MDVRQLRRAARMTQYELAERTGISRMRLSLAECGYISLTIAELSAIEDATVSSAQDRLQELSRVTGVGGQA
jgi:transcriptional regulator with XRE-family HTH domain